MTLDRSDDLRPGDLPETLQIGEFILKVKEYTNQGRWDQRNKITTGAAGEGWVSFDCGNQSSQVEVPVTFKQAAIQVSIRTQEGQIIKGNAVSQENESYSLSISGFDLILESLILKPDQAAARITLILPGSIANTRNCGPATLDLESVSIRPDCKVIEEKLSDPFGPWLIGETGLIVSGTGYIVNLGPSSSPPLTLLQGTASGKSMLPDVSNTGYLTGQYQFTAGSITDNGLECQAELQEEHTFFSVNPFGYEIDFGIGTLNIGESRILSGTLEKGTVIIPEHVSCYQTPGNPVHVSFESLNFSSDLSLSGKVVIKDPEFGWGDLSQSKNLFWKSEADEEIPGDLYLPSSPLSSFNPVSDGGFIDLDNLDAWKGITGITVRLKKQTQQNGREENIDRFKIYSLDCPGWDKNPFVNVSGWLRFGENGIDGEIEINEVEYSNVFLGNQKRPGYAGNVSFGATLFPDRSLTTLVQFADSAVYESWLDGYLTIPVPCEIEELDFSNLKLTSTANLVGGEVKLPDGGVNLSHWDLELVSSDSDQHAGVLSVRTGRLFFTAAGIHEPRHFTKPFELTWGEMLADGNLGELFFDHNNFGQRFDGFPFSPHQIELSKYTGEYEYSADEPDLSVYLAVCGTLHFDFFGTSFVNIKDARHDDPSSPFWGRWVKVPASGDSDCPVTNLHLQHTWFDILGEGLTVFDFPDEDVCYNEEYQDGFYGSGTAAFSFFKTGTLSATIQLDRNTIDIKLESDTGYALDLGLFNHIGGLTGISGCIQIQDSLLEMISLFGYLEHASNAGISGILAAKTAFLVEANLTVTPNSLDLYASGDMLLSVAESAVDACASAHLFYDYTSSSAEGEVIGRIDCNSVLAGLEGEGQITWYIGPDKQYLQGRMKMGIAGWIGSAGLEGGFFLGHKVPRDRAWAISGIFSHPFFGVSTAILPQELTGIYGYGQAEASINWEIFSGGFSLYAGIGAFSGAPNGEITEWDDLSDLGLPYVLGSCGLYIHGEVLGGLVSGHAFADLDVHGPIPLYYEGRFGIGGCALWVFCDEIELIGGLNENGFYLSV